jgi:hypothetical protein
MKNKYKKIIILLICELISLSILFFNESVVKEFSNVIYILLLTIGVTLSTNSVAAWEHPKVCVNLQTDVR